MDGFLSWIDDLPPLGRQVLAIAIIALVGWCICNGAAGPITHSG